MAWWAKLFVIIYKNKMSIQEKQAFTIRKPILNLWSPHHILLPILNTL